MKDLTSGLPGDEIDSDFSNFTYTSDNSGVSGSQLSLKSNDITKAVTSYDSDELESTKTYKYKYSAYLQGNPTYIVDKVFNMNMTYPCARNDRLQI